MSERKPQTAVLVMAYGTPDTPAAIEPYFTDIRRGRPPSPEQLHELTERYNLIGGVSPLYAITMNQAAGIQKALNIASPGAYRVFVGMKHWHPRIEEAVQQINGQGIKRVMGVVLAPHYSAFSIGEYIHKAEESFHHSPEIVRAYVKSWGQEPFFIMYWATAISEAFDKFRLPPERTFTLFTAHSLPEEPILKSNDPYPREIRESAETIAAAVGLEHWDTAYSSAGMTQFNWLGPDYCDCFADIRKRGFTHLLAVPVGFTCDHLEVLFDVDIEGQAKAKEAGLLLFRPQMPNANPEFLSGLATVIRKEGGKISS